MPTRWLAALAATALAYYLGGRLGLSVPYVGSHVSLIWPPTGIAMAAMLRWGTRMWPGIWLGAFLVNLSVGSSLTLAVGIACGNTLGPWLAAQILEKRGFRPALERRRDLLSYLGVAVIGGMAVNASNGVIHLSLAGFLPAEQFAQAWLFWWLGDAVGALVVGIPLLTLDLAAIKRALCCWRGVETVAAMALSTAVAAWMFGAGAAVSPANPLMFLPFLLLGWLALRSGIWAASLTALLLSAIAAWHTTHGHGPFQQGDAHQGLALLWSYMASMSVVTTLVTVVIAELKASEQHFREMFKRHAAVMLLIDPQDGRIVDANPSAESFYGYSLEQLCRMNIADINALPAEQVAHKRREARHEHRNVFIFPHRLANGEIRTVEIHSSPVEDGEGKALLFSIIHDITERRHAEEALRKSEERLFLVLRGTNDGVWDWDLKRDRLYYSPRWWEMLGYDQGTGEEGPQVWRRLTHPDDLARVEERLGKAMHSRAKSTEIEFRLRHRDGHYLPVLARAYILRDEVGNALRLTGAITDLSERKRAEEWLAHILKVSPNAIYQVALDPQDGKPPLVSFMSENIIQMVGYSLEDWHQPGFWESHIHADDRQRVLANQQRIRDSGVLQHEYRFRHSDGRWLWIHDQLVLERDEAGRPVGIVGSWLDITQRKEAEQALRRLNEGLEQRIAEEVAKNREKDHLLIQQSRLAAMGEMIGNIAHQWRQPINALALLLANLKDDYEFGELTREVMDLQIRKGQSLIQRMSTTIDDFRNFFRPDREKAPFHLRAAFAEVREILGASLKAHNIDLQEDIPSDIQVNGYANEFAQMLLNLVNNAREAILAREIGAGYIRVSMYEQDGQALVRVSDNGGGIPADVLPRIFDPYFTTKEKGTGIGLYMAKAIVESNMGGRIAVRNADGGAEFSVTLPLDG